MRTRRSTPEPAFSLLFLALTALLAAWAGCSASGSSHVTSGSGSGGGSSLSGGGGGDGGVGGGATDGGDGGLNCSTTQKVCNGVCVAIDDPKYGCSPTYCTACADYANAMTACSGGACALGDCNAGFKNCDGKDSNGCETNIQNDPQQCGACGTPCVLAHATPVCNNGVCGVGSCDMGGWTDCSGDAGAGDGGTPDLGCTTNTQSDPTSCGTCGNACPGQETCVSGMCSSVCPKGFCTSDPAHPCEAMSGTDKNCAADCLPCDLPNSMSQCVTMMGVSGCSITTCNPGWGNCDGMGGNGCETNTQTDPNHCGDCGNPPCPSGPHSTPVCNAGTCGIVCDSGYADCDHIAVNGCEVHIDGDPANCGSCGAACSTNHATEQCTAGVCNIVTCSSGYNDCNQSAADGCEDGTQTDPNNCGMCGVICKTQNGTPACTQGMCGVGSCNPGFAHCPGQPGTNCETSTGTDTSNCGMCGNVCSTNHDTPSCTGGVCILQCAPLFGDCDNSPGNGCETGLNTVTHCGSCTTMCTTQNGSPTCMVSGNTATCAVGGCSAGYASCPGDGTNCATFVGGTDVNNCGGCGVVCTTAHGTPDCVGGHCGIASCNTGYAHCASTGTDCEDNIANDNSNCGACGNSCLAVCGGAAKHVTGTTCANNACSITSCAGGWENTDGTCPDGCECGDSTTASTCAGAHTLTLNVPVVSNLFPATPNAAYYSVTFSGNNSIGFHPKITLSDPDNEFVMDVASDCSDTLITTCTDNATHSGSVTIWETSYVGPSPQADPTDPNFKAIPLPGNNGTVYIKVYRKNPASVTCNNQFTLTATD